MVNSKDPIVARALNAYRGMVSRGVVVNAASRRITNPIVANAVRAFARKVMNGEAVATNVPVVENEMTDDEKRKRGWTQDEKGEWHRKPVKEDPGKGEQSAGSAEPSASEKAAIAKMTPEQKAAKAEEIKKELAEIKAEKEGGGSGSEGAGGSSDGTTVDGADEGGKSDAPKAEKRTSNSYPGKADASALGRPKKWVNKEKFTMGLEHSPTGPADGAEKANIDAAFKKATADHAPFVQFNQDIANSLGYTEGSYKNPTAGTFFTRSKLKGEKRVLEKMQENFEESPDGYRGVNDIVDLDGSTLVLRDGDDVGEVVEKIRKMFDDGMAEFEIVRDKNCYTGPYNSCGYGDTKLNVRGPNGSVTEIILGTEYMMKMKMAGPGHAIYEGHRSMSKLMKEAVKGKDTKTVDEIESIRKDLDALSRQVYIKPGEDHSDFEQRREAAVRAMERIEALVKDHGDSFNEDFVKDLPKLKNKIAAEESYGDYRAELEKRLG